MPRFRYYYEWANTSHDNELRVWNCSEKPVAVYTRTEPEWARTGMDRHRKRPKPLRPTDATFREYKEISTTGTYWPCGAYPYSTSLRAGSAYRFVFNSQSYKHRTKTYSSKDDGQLAAMQMLAGSTSYGSFENFGETFAELNQTGAMILNRARQIASMANALRRGDWNSLSQQIGPIPRSVTSLRKDRRLADGWLEVHFGWLPLVSAVYGAVEAYRSSIVNGANLSFKRFGSRPLNDMRDQALFAQSLIDGSKPRASARVYATVQNSKLYTLNKLGLINPASLAWDLLPYSFVVDWFYPIGRTLKYLTDRVGLSDYYMVSTHEQISFAQWTALDAIERYDRTVYREVHRPSIIPPIGYSPRNLGVWHATTAAALVQQAFGRR